MANLLLVSGYLPEEVRIGNKLGRCHFQLKKGLIEGILIGEALNVRFQFKKGPVVKSKMAFRVVGELIHRDLLILICFVAIGAAFRNQSDVSILELASVA